MFKYYVIATFIVLSVAVFVTAYRSYTLAKITIAPTTVPASPKAQPADTDSKRVDVAFHGDAQWALSELPDCVIQATLTEGNITFVRSHIPATAREIAPGSMLHYGPCTISVMNGEAVVARGADRMHIPPHVSFFQAGADLLLLRTTGTHGELRTYTSRN